MTLRRADHNLLKARPALAGKGGWAFLYSAVILPIVLVAGFTVIGLGAYAGGIGARVYGHAASGRNELIEAQRLVGELDVRGAIRRLDEADARLDAAAAELGKLESFAGLPYVGPRVTTAARLIATGEIAVGAVREVLAVIDDIAAVIEETEGLKGALTGSLPELTTAFKDLSPQQKRRILSTLAESAPKIRDSSSKIDAALLSLDQIESSPGAAEIADSVAALRPKLVALQGGLAAFLPAAEHLPTLLGYPGERNYLFFLQNNTELRPTGGFLGTFGLITVADAELRSMETHDVYTYDGPSEALPRPAPPDPIRKYIGIDKWYLRDANWSPDLPTSAEVMERFYKEEASVVLGGKVPPVDGIIAVTPKFAADIMALTGPITVDKVAFDAENLVDTLEFQVERGFVTAGVPFEQRKRILARLAAEVVERVKAFPLAKVLSVIAVAHQNLQEGHISLFMNDPGLQRFVLEHDWGGKLRDVRGDYLSWIDANLASLKSDRMMERTLSYAIVPQADGSYEGRAAMTYAHKGGFDWKTTRYRTYARVYVPAGSTLVSVSGAMENDKIKDPNRRPGKADVYQELGRTAFGAFISIEPGERRTLEFRFTLAPGVVQGIAGGRYQLDVEKQAGTEAHGLTLDLDFGKQLRTAEPAEERQEWGNARYRIRSDLRVDRRFEIGF
jgi:hypothetical protein